jgi:hypothetical protein
LSAAAHVFTARHAFRATHRRHAHDAALSRSGKRQAHLRRHENTTLILNLAAG